jgi:hypothetical protein
MDTEISRGLNGSAAEPEGTERLQGGKQRSSSQPQTQVPVLSDSCIKPKPGYNGHMFGKTLPSGEEKV